MRMKFKNKYIAFILSFIILASNINIYTKADIIKEIETDNVQKYDLEKSELESEDEATFNKDNDLFEKEKNKKIRVIVELDGKAVIDEAVKRNIEYKDLPENIIKEKMDEIEKEQEEFISYADNSDIEIDDTQKRSYDTIFNGIALNVKEDDIERLEKIKGVKNVYISEEFERPLLDSSKDIIGTNYAWDTLGYKGEGTTVAVIDSGLDYKHKALVLEDEGKLKLNKQEVDNIISKENLKGKYYSSKIPYGYNYYDFNDNLYDSYGVMHGMHVSGIIAANDKNIKGVAPNAQILAMKVFSDDRAYPTTFTDIWLKALDDAIKLKADVVNMSLGSPAGFAYKDREYPEENIINKANAAGIVVSVAAGNDANIVNENIYRVDALKENYDTAEIANPAINENTIAVASMENKKQKANLLKWKNGFNVEKKESIILAGPPHSRSKIIAEFIDLKDANDLNIPKEKIENKIALVEYPSSGNVQEYMDKLKKISELKPVAIGLYNDKNLNDSLRGGLSLLGGAAKFVIFRMKRSTYDEINRDKLSVFRGLKLEIPNEVEEIDNPFSGEISSFSSWGPSPDLRIKPEITAPGGNIYSTSEDNEYKNMSGTSMAAPQVAGAGAILKQYIRDKNIKVENEADFIKLLLMNTATPIVDKNTGLPYFVRQQGSGAMNLEKALKTPVVVSAIGTNDDKKDGKLELKELDNKKFKAKLEFENFSNEDKTYIIKLRAIGEKIENLYRIGKARALNSNMDNMQKEINIRANEKKSIDFNIDYSDTDLEKDNFIEGYFEIEDKDNIKKLDLSIPFLGFYGDWDKQSAIDSFNLKENNNEKRNIQFYINKDEKTTSSLFVTTHMLPLPIVDNTIYFSPSSTYHNNIVARLAPLRNMENVEFSILDKESGKKLRTLGKTLYVRKLNALGRNNSFRMMPDSLWDGKINGMEIEENKKYIYEIKAKLNTNKSSEQIYRYDIATDNTEPIIYEGTKLQKSSKKDDRLVNVSMKLKDAGIGLQDIYIESVKYEKTKNENINFPGLDTPPSSGKKNEIKKEGSKFIGKAKYGKFTKISFVDEEVKDGKVLPKVLNGKLFIPKDAIPNNEYENGSVFVCINGHRNKDIEVICPYFADTSHIQVIAKDQLSNKASIELETGFDENYNTINFLNFYNSIKENNIDIYVNDIKLDKNTYTSKENKLKVKIKLNNNKYISTLYIKKNKRDIAYIIDMDNYKLDNVEKYKYKYNEDENSIEFELDPFDHSCEIITAFKDGKTPEIKEKKDINIDLSKISLDNFKEIKLDNESIEVDSQNPSFITKSGRIKLQLIYADNAKKDIDNISIRQAGKIIKLKKEQYFDLEEERCSGYSSSRYAINIYYNIDDDADIEIKYKNEGLAQSKLASSSDGEDINESDINDEEYKYPNIFITSPSLLDVVSDQLVKDGNLLVKGFVSNIKNDDEILYMNINLVDKYGNLINDQIKIDQSELIKKPLSKKEKGKNIIYGYIYEFEKELPVEGFNLNIRAEVFTKKGLKASIVRRLFYDNKRPEIKYKVQKHSLGADSASINIKVSDNSIKLKLYKGDSLIDVVDNTSISFESDTGVQLEKEIDFELSKGQNHIIIKAEDLAGQISQKDIYIYRTQN